MMEIKKHYFCKNFGKNHVDKKAYPEHNYLLQSDKWLHFNIFDF